MLRPALAALLVAAPALGLAEDGPRLAFALGAGASTVPSYFGSDEVVAGPSLSLSQGYLSFGGLDLGDDDPTDIETGWGFRGSFRYVAARDAGEVAGVAGLTDLGPAFELGGGVEYARSWWSAFAVARVGVGGHDDLVGEVGMDLISRPAGNWELRAGPRITLGSDGYATTYFGTPGFEASGGVLSSGVELGATYDLTDRWGLSATARYDRLQGDAAASPVTEEDDQVSATLELTRRFDFRF